jgi:hypothetical protein
VEARALVAAHGRALAQLPEVLGRLGRDVGLELHHDAAQRDGVAVAAELDVEKHQRVGLRALRGGVRGRARVFV